MKSRPKLARSFGCSLVSYSMRYIVPFFVARQHKKTSRKHVDSSLKVVTMATGEDVSFIFLLILVYTHAICL